MSHYRCDACRLEKSTVCYFSVCTCPCHHPEKMGGNPKPPTLKPWDFLPDGGQKFLIQAAMARSKAAQQIWGDSVKHPGNWQRERIANTRWVAKQRARCGPACSTNHQHSR